MTQGGPYSAKLARRRRAVWPVVLGGPPLITLLPARCSAKKGLRFIFFKFLVRSDEEVPETPRHLFDIQEQN